MNFVLAWVALLGPPELGGKPVPDDEIGWLTNAPWAKLALLLTIAVIVMFVANIFMQARRNRVGGRHKPDFDLRVAKLEALPVTPIGAAKSGAVHLVGTLRNVAGALGSGEHACVFQNRAGSSRSTAIATELVLLTDESGTVGIEQLEGARVIAPREEHGPHETIALYLGDRVEVVGELLLFDSPETVNDEPLRGLLGSLGQIQVRLIERPRAGVDSPSSPSPTPSDSSEIS
jgi:hypothetical protein